MLNWPAFSPDFSPTESIWCIMTRKIQDCGTTIILYQTRVWYSLFFSKQSNSWSPRLLDVYRLFLKEDRMLHGGKHGPIPTILRHCSFSVKVVHVLSWTKCGFIRFAKHCIMFLCTLTFEETCIHKKSKVKYWQLHIMKSYFIYYVTLCANKCFNLKK